MEHILVVVQDIVLNGGSDLRYVELIILSDHLGRLVCLFTLIYLLAWRSLDDGLLEAGVHKGAHVNILALSWLHIEFQLISETGLSHLVSGEEVLIVRNVDHIASIVSVGDGKCILLDHFLHVALRHLCFYYLFQSIKVVRNLTDSLCDVLRVDQLHSQLFL